MFPLPPAPPTIPGPGCVLAQVRTSLQSVTLHAHQPVPYATVHTKTSDASAPCDSPSSPSSAAQPRHSAAAQASAAPASASIANAANTGREAAVAHSAGGLGTSTGPVAASHGSNKVAPPTVASGGQGHALPQQPALDARIVDRMAQTSAFPPNYIHSLDASHMMMTAIECRRHGIAFAGGMHQCLGRGRTTGPGGEGYCFELLLCTAPCTAGPYTHCSSPLHVYAVGLARVTCPAVQGACVAATIC